MDCLTTKALNAGVSYHSIVRPMIVVYRDETIFDILQYSLQQYNTIWYKGNINILHIAIYYDILQCLLS